MSEASAPKAPVRSQLVEVACVQLGPPGTETPAERLTSVRQLLEGLERVDLVVLPEMWPIGYFAFDAYRQAAASLDEPLRDLAGSVARTTGAYVAAGTFVEAASDGGLRNTCLLADPTGHTVLPYRKVHLFSHNSREPELIEAGREIEAVTSALGTIGFAVCYDLRFPELFRLLAAQGAEIIVVPSAWPAARLEHWRLLARARALENQAYLVGCNAAGEDHGTALAGHSLVADPWGELVAEAGDEPTVLRATLDMGLLARTRAEFPALRDRRIDLPDLPRVAA
jgi:predicted amidohydrolase